jgi:Glycosyltransferase family 87
MFSRSGRAAPAWVADGQRVTGGVIAAPRVAGLAAAGRIMGVWLLALALLAVMVVDSPRVIGFDSHAYWLAWHRTSMYGSSPNTEGAFLYSPAFAQLLWPFAQLPWLAFLAFWTVGGFALYGWLLWPMPLVYRLPLLVICIPQVVIGNIWPLFAVVALVGFRRPAVWAFPLLTKVTAATGFVWFLVRREWRSFAVAALVSVSVTAVSVAISPGLWIDWLRLLIGGGDGGTPSGTPNIPLVARLPIALLLAVYAALRNRPRLLIFTIGLASPVFTASLLLSNLMVLAALPRLGREPSRSRSADRPEARPLRPG